ncbi:MAG TPA: biotin carboxylase N-terminal domain-containing protein [Gammaproteobacteria bacterium]|nr:biotin carboxylase N-terminal domain-containing protein [Gammaproteobacteria bacterium]
MTINKLLIANRGEIAVRIARAAAELGIATVAVHPADDAQSLHIQLADEACPIPGVGAAAYLAGEQLLKVALATGCDAVHPGYGFLSESEAFAQLCEQRGLTFVGPSAAVLGLLGDKARARQLAQQHDVPVVLGTSGAVGLDEARAFMAELGDGVAVVVKAVAGGGGRGMRIVHQASELEEAFKRCQAEAEAAFGNGALYVERFIPRARHIEVQVIGDGSGRVSHLWERECSLQRCNQKLVEIAPSPTLDGALRQRIIAAALRLAAAVEYRNLGTFEFLVDEQRGDFFFIEANVRLQVEHTVTEEITGIDLVQAQLLLAGGESLESLGLTQAQIPAPQGFAMQLRINMETMDSTGNAQPAGGVLATFEPPTGPGIRVDSFGYRGYRTSPHYDSLLAKLIVHTRGRSFAATAERAYRALCQFRIEGVATNIGFLQNLLSREEVVANAVYTRFVDEHMAALVAQQDGSTHPQLFFASANSADDAAADRVVVAPAGTTAVLASMQGVVVDVVAAEGETVREGQLIAVVEAMKMQHEMLAAVGGRVRQVLVAPGDLVVQAQPLLFIEPSEVAGAALDDTAQLDLDAIRPDLAEVLERHALGLDEARPEAVARRRKTGQRTARENIAAICDPGSFIE